jgi:rhodanese-related sulfurtransferase
MIIFEKKYMDLSQKDWTEKLMNNKDAIVLDVRTPEECLEGIIPNALMIDIFKGQGFVYEVDVLDKNKEIYVYCKAGSRSAQACNIMNQLGFENTFNLLGGFMQWKGDVIFPK